MPRPRRHTPKARTVAMIPSWLLAWANAIVNLPPDDAAGWDAVERDLAAVGLNPFSLLDLTAGPAPAPPALAEAIVRAVEDGRLTVGGEAVLTAGSVPGLLALLGLEKEARSV